MDGFSWENAVIYEIYIRSFNDSDGDGTGDLNGIREKLGYIKALGADAIWISPFFVSPGADNGYDISDYDRIDPVYGSMEDFEALVAEAHEMGIRVITDMVLNHSSSQHPWFRAALTDPASPFRDRYIWTRRPNNWGSRFGGSAWHFDENSGEYYLGLFSPEQPDFNWENPGLRRDVCDMLRRWAARGVDGFRLDVISLISKPSDFPDGIPDESGYADFHPFVSGRQRTHELIRELRREVFSPCGLVTVGEASGMTLDSLPDYTVPEREELDLVFSFEHVGLDGSEEYKWTDRKIDPAELARVLTKWQLCSGSGRQALFFENHDQPRMPSRICSDDRLMSDAAKSLAACLLFMKGVPVIYQGEELGMTNPCFSSPGELRDIEALNAFSSLTSAGTSPEEAMRIISLKTRDNGRTPMQWNAEDGSGFSDAEPWIKLNGNYRELNAQAQEADGDSVLSFYKALIRLRRAKLSAVTGDFIPCPAGSGIMAFERRGADGKGLFVACSFIDVPGECPVPAEYSGGEILMSSKARSFCAQSLTLLPCECIIIAQKEKST